MKPSLDIAFFGSSIVSAFRLGAAPTAYARRAQLADSTLTDASAPAMEAAS